MKTQEPVEVEVVDMDVELQVYDKVSAAVDAAMERCANIVLSYDTAADIALSKSWIFQNLNKLNPLIKQAGKLGKAEALKFTKAMDTMKNELLEKVAKQIEDKYAPIKLIEDAAKKDAEEIEAWEMQLEICEQETRQAEYDAEQKKLAEEQEALKKKQEAFEQKEREARITEEVKRKAEADAQEAKDQAGRKAIDDMLAAHERHLADIQREREEASRVLAERDLRAMEANKQEAEAAAQEKERQAIEAQKVEREKKEAEEMAETARINDTAHRLAVNTEIYNKIKYVVYTAEQHAQMAAVNTEDRSLVVAKEVFKALQKNNIPHITINY